MLKGLPRNVKLFVFLWLFAYIGMRGTAWLLALVAGARTASDKPQLSLAIILTFVLGSAIPLWLFWLAVWRRKFWARSLLIIIYAFGLFSFLSHIFRWFGDPARYSASGSWYASIMFAIEGVALVLLCTGDAHAWFWEDPPAEIAKLE